jgi:hypothetical protein
MEARRWWKYDMVADTLISRFLPNSNKSTASADVLL